MLEGQTYVKYRPDVIEVHGSASVNHTFSWAAKMSQIID